MTSHQLELCSLMLPNKLIKGDRGGRLVNYTHVYVELQNLTSPNSGNRGVIYSNNPNSSKMLFTGILDDNSSDAVTPFIKIDSDGMSNVVKFKPNDALSFSVRLPNGKVLETIEKDSFSPNEPNPELQIKAVFALKRIDR